MSTDVQIQGQINELFATPERIGFVVLDGGKFVGCSSGLANKNGNKYCMWFYLTDLFIEKAYRGHGLEKQLLRKLEERIISLGMHYIWTWTAGYEAPGFYKKQGYEIFCELKNWYLSGHSRFGMHKRLWNK